MKKLALSLLSLVLLVASLTACGRNTSATLGVITDKTYESTFINLGFMLPDGFTFAGTEQIRERYGVTYTESNLADAPILYDMYAEDAQGNSVSVSLENISLMSSPTSSPKRCLEEVAQAVGMQMEQMGLTDVKTEATVMTVAGRSFDALMVTSVFGDTTFYQTYLCEEHDGYMATITIVSLNEATYGTLLNSFYQPGTPT